MWLVVVSQRNYMKARTCPSRHVCWTDPDTLSSCQGPSHHILWHQTLRCVHHRSEWRSVVRSQQDLSRLDPLPAAQLEMIPYLIGGCGIRMMAGKVLRILKCIAGELRENGIVAWRPLWAPCWVCSRCSPHTPWARTEAPWSCCSQAAADGRRSRPPSLRPRLCS